MTAAEKPIALPKKAREKELSELTRRQTEALERKRDLTEARAQHIFNGDHGAAEALDEDIAAEANEIQTIGEAIGALSDPKSEAEKEFARLSKRLAAARDELKQLTERRSGYVVDAMRGDAVAQEHSDRLRDDITAREREISELNQKISQLRADVVVAQEASLRNRRLSRVARVAKLREIRFEAAARVVMSAEAFGESVRAMSRAGQNLADELGTKEAARIFSMAGLSRELVTGLHEHFLFEESGNAMVDGPRKYFLPLIVDGAREFKMPMIINELRILDLIARMFETREAADAAAERLAAIKEKVVVVPRPDGGFVLVDADCLFATEVEARYHAKSLEARGFGADVIPYRGGYAVGPA